MRELGANDQVRELPRDKELTSENSSSETVRKGCEQRFDPVFCWYAMAKIGQKVPFGSLQSCVADPSETFSDSFGRQILASPAS